MLRNLRKASQKIEKQFDGSNLEVNGRIWKSLCPEFSMHKFNRPSVDTFHILFIIRHTSHAMHSISHVNESTPDDL